MSEIETEGRNDVNKKDLAEHSDRRRRLLKGLAATAPIIMTVANRPAWGAQCWSGIQSGNMSRAPEGDCVGGLSPGYYKNNYASNKNPGWPAGYNPGYPSDYTDAPIPDGFLKNSGTQEESKFYGESPVGCFNHNSALGPIVQQVQDVFVGATGTQYEGYTLMQALWQFPGDFIFHAIATYFTALHYNTPGNQYIFTPNQVLIIINDILATGTYIDDQGIMYDGEQMNVFLIRPITTMVGTNQILTDVYNLKFLHGS